MSENEEKENLIVWISRLVKEMAVIRLSELKMLIPAYLDKAYGVREMAEEASKRGLIRKVSYFLEDDPNEYVFYVHASTQLNI